MANREKELSRFVNEPKYRESVLAQIRRESDGRYEKRIRTLRSEKDRLVSSRAKEIKRITDARWESVADGKLFVNTTEGKVRINDTEVSICDIHGAEPNVQLLYRVETEHTGESKNRGSLAGAVVGGLVAGGIGAVAGGIGLGKTKTSGKSVQNQTAICTHLGVAVNIKNFVSEIVLLSKEVEQKSSDYIEAERDAQLIITTLAALRTSPMPTSYVEVEDEPAIKEYDERIVAKEREIQDAIDDTPTYEIPDMYRTVEQSEMTDDEYLAYLANDDASRAETLGKKPYIIDIEKATKAHESFGKIGTVIGWICSGLALLLSLLSGEDMASIIFFSIAAVSVNPMMYKYVLSKVSFVRKWMLVVLFIVAFVGGMITLSNPRWEKDADTNTSAETESVDGMANIYWEMI